MPAPLPDDHPIFGPCITVRRKGLADRIIWGVLVFLLIFTGIILLVGGIFSLSKANGDGVFALLMAIGMFVGSWFAIRGIARRVEFYHHGIVDRMFSKVREYPFEGATELKYNLARRYMHGVYIGTLLQLQIKVFDDRVFRFNGIHKERPVGLSVTIFKKKFKGEDELDVVRDIIGSHVVQTFLRRLQSEAYVPWGSEIGISLQGLMRLRSRPPTLAPWTDIAGLRSVRSRVAIDLIEQDKPLAYVDPTCMNFFPCLELFRLLMNQAHGVFEEEEETAEELEEGASPKSPGSLPGERGDRSSR